MKKYIQVKKIGLLNFWYYDEEEYEFYDGKLLLRGGNGSGKSVTMQSFFPLILDGNKAPIRLDPFGSRDKKIEDYLIGPADTIQKDENTGYLYMETYNEESDQYITVGIGLRAKKGRPTDFWGFALKDGRRIGQDFLLYKSRTEKIPFSKLELKSRLGAENEFVETVKDYKMMVNRLLFGFSNLDSYDEFINLILQLRSPKLSNGYKPTTLMEILNKVLQPLLEEDLKPLSEAIEEMNKTKEQVELLEQHARSLSNYIKTYTNYNETWLYYKSKNYVSAYNEDKLLKQEKKEIQTCILKEKEKIEHCEMCLSKTEQESENAKLRKFQLNESELVNKVEKLEQLSNYIAETTKKLDITKEKLGISLEKEISIKGVIQSLEDELYQIEKDIDEIVVEIQNLSEDVYFTELSIALSNINETNQKKIDCDFLESSIRKYKRKVIQIKQQLEKIEQLELLLDGHLKEHEMLKKEYVAIEKESGIIEHSIKDEIDNFKENFNDIHQHNTILQLHDEDVRIIFDFLNHYTRDNFLKAKQTYIDIAEKIRENLLEKKVKLEHKLQSEEDNKSVLLLEKRELEEKKEIELIYDYEYETNQKLEKNAIKYDTFYKVITFHDDVPNEVRNAIEEALLQAHFLGAKIISEADRTKIQELEIPGVFLYRTEKKKHNLTKYLKPQLDNDVIFDAEYITQILQSVSIDRMTHDIVIDEYGYKMDFIEGSISKQYQSKYIDILTRQEEREKALLSVNKKINSINQVMSNICGMIAENNDALKQLENEKSNFPKANALEQLETKKHNLKKDLEYIDGKQKQLEPQIEQVTKEKEKLEKTIFQMKEDLSIPLNLGQYKEAIKNIELLEQNMIILNKMYNSYLHKQELYQMKQISREETSESISYLHADVLEKETRIENFKIEYETIEQLLNERNYKKIKEELQDLERILNRIPKEREEIQVKKINAQNELKNLEIKFNENKQKQIRNQVYLRTYEYIFKKEYQLHYVYENDNQELIQRASVVLKDLKDKEKSTIAGVTSLYYEAYNKYRLELNDYNLNDIGLIESDNIITTLVASNKELEEEVDKILAENTRRDITAIYEGRKMTLLRLHQNIDNAVLETKDIINEQDRHLFEDILLNTVGEKIRKRIEDSEIWVKKINSIMDNMQKESSLSFQLAWKSKTSDSEQEIDTKEIVRILKIDPTIATQKDINKLINHFRARIKKAEVLNEDNYISYYNIIFDVLDYRNWFYFQMYYKQGNQERKELTDKVFSRFSGGEKAKTMYIPMFASVYSKLLSARDDALRIVALDEAFAGVDYKNIRELLGIMISLDLDFIMTSQVLWGDYDIVPLLSICELLADKGSETVAVRRYKWNGKTKVIIGDKYE